MSTPNPLKRLTPDSNNDTSSQHLDPSSRPLKRPKTTPLTPLQLPTPISSQPAPQKSPPPSKTTCLKLEIPEVIVTPQPTKRELAARKGAAKRFVPRLRDPFPTDAEVRKAYNLKLLRDYSVQDRYKRSNRNEKPGDQDEEGKQKRTKSSVSVSGEVEEEGEVILPEIKKSARIMSLLSSFPSTSIKPPTLNQVQEEQSNLDKVLAENAKIIFGKEGKMLAIRHFGGVRRPWSPMVNSGIEMDDLEKETRGIPNQLPEWRKWNTGKRVRKEKEMAMARESVEEVKGDAENSPVKKQRSWRKERKERKKREREQLALLEMQRDSAKPMDEDRLMEEKPKKLKIRFVRTESGGIRAIPIYE